MDQLLQLRSLTGPQQQRMPRVGLKVTDWTVLDSTPDAPTITLLCHQHTWWVAKWDGKGTATRVQTHTPETRAATPLALKAVSGTQPTTQTIPGTLAGTQKGHALDSRCPCHRHHTPHHAAHPGPQRCGLRAQTWDDTDATLDVMAHG